MAMAVASCAKATTSSADFIATPSELAELDWTDEFTQALSHDLLSWWLTSSVLSQHKPKSKLPNHDSNCNNKNGETFTRPASSTAATTLVSRRASLRYVGFGQWTQVLSVSPRPSLLSTYFVAILPPSSPNSRKQRIVPRLPVTSSSSTRRPPTQVVVVRKRQTMASARRPPTQVVVVHKRQTTAPVQPHQPKPKMAADTDFQELDSLVWLDAGNHEDKKQQQQQQQQQQPANQDEDEAVVQQMLQQWEHELGVMVTKESKQQCSKTVKKSSRQDSQFYHPPTHLHHQHNSQGSILWIFLFWMWIVSMTLTGWFEMDDHSVSSSSSSASPGRTTTTTRSRSHHHHHHHNSKDVPERFKRNSRMLVVDPKASR